MVFFSPADVDLLPLPITVSYFMLLGILHIATFFSLHLTYIN